MTTQGTETRQGQDLQGLGAKHDGPFGAADAAQPTDNAETIMDVQQAVPVAGEDNLASGSKAFAVDAKIEYPAFTSWWARTIPAVPVPNSASHHFDAWMASARHRLTEPARKADRLGGDQEAIAREVLAQNLGPRLAAHVRKGGHGYITVANALDAIRAALPDPTHTREGELEAALKPFADLAQGEVWERFIADSKMNLRISNGSGSAHYCFINAECFEAARAALNALNARGGA
jgi:hypothetical protein